MFQAGFISSTRLSKAVLGCSRRDKKINNNEYNSDRLQTSPEGCPRNGRRVAPILWSAADVRE